MKILEEKHKLATRWFHWLNFPLLAAMIFSGLLIYWAYDPYRVGFGSVTLFHFFPDWFYNATGISQQLALGMALHFVLAWLFAINGIAYVLYTLISGEWRELIPDRKSPGEALQVALHDAGFKIPLPPQGRYNAAQRMTYTAIVIMGGFSLLTGLAIYKPAQLFWLAAALGGYQWARFEHFWLMIGFVAFFAIHIAQVIRAGWPNFRAMVSGYDLISAPDLKPDAAEVARLEKRRRRHVEDKPRTPEQELARKTRRGFLLMGAGAAGMVGVWHWLNELTPDGDISSPLRSVLGVNEDVVRTALFSDSHLVKTFPASAVGRIKVNGEIGMDQPIEPSAWNLTVTPASGGDRTLSLADVQSLPRREEIIDFKCVEGWSTVTQFAGARLADFTAKFVPGSEKAAWVGMDTPAKDYYVGLDMPSALHPQTLLAWEMNGKPLEDRHGAPLRLVIPVKYGIKNIKRIAHIWYTDQRPKDYWFEQGYDYYSGL